jgi:hypothetical protein
MLRRGGIGRVACVAALMAVVLRANPALGAWVVNEQGECVHAWTPGSLLRGPTAMLNAPLLPFRSVAGGGLLAYEDQSPGLQAKILLPPTLVVAGGAMGLVESIIWFGTGASDTVTAGYFEVAPDEATRLAIGPVRPPFGGAARSPAREWADQCGRRVEAAAP